MKNKIVHRKEDMKARSIINNNKGVTLIELLVALVIGGIIIGGIYRLFVAQTTAYTVQDQVIEVQQNIRSGMEILLRDLRMTGFDDDNDPQFVHPPAPAGQRNAYTVNGNNSITINYKYFDTTTLQYQIHSVAYWRDDSIPDNRKLIRQLTNVTTGVASPQEILLDKVEAQVPLFTYGIDANSDGVPDAIVANWPAGTPGLSNVIAIRVRLTGGPEQVNAQDDRFRNLNPRALDSIVTLRNLK
jgi:prepilin-type N-terminal cleavage/methylation domain-containing protein